MQALSLKCYLIFDLTYLFNSGWTSPVLPVFTELLVSKARKINLAVKIASKIYFMARGLVWTCRGGFKNKVTAAVASFVIHIITQVDWCLLTRDCNYVYFPSFSLQMITIPGIWIQ